jgi:hypothetical protein
MTPGPSSLCRPLFITGVPSASSQAVLLITSPSTVSSYKIDDSTLPADGLSSPAALGHWLQLVVQLPLCSL